MEGSKYFLPQPHAVLVVTGGSGEIHLCCCVRKCFSFCALWTLYFLFPKMGVLVWDSKKNQKIQKTSHVDDSLFGISCLFKASGNWDEIMKASSC